MSNKTQLQTNNTTLASLTETLRSKAVSGGEDVTTETNAYTTKLATLETAITALETELQGKASGGSGGSDTIKTCNVTVTTDNGSHTSIFYTSINNNGEVVAKALSPEASNTPILLTVVCNTTIGVHFNVVSPIYTGSGFSDCNPSDWDYLNHIALLSPSEANAQAFLNCINDN